MGRFPSCVLGGNAWAGNRFGLAVAFPVWMGLEWGMPTFDPQQQEAFKSVRQSLVPPHRPRPGLRHLLAAAAFAAVTAILSAAAVIFGLPGIDKSAIKVETSVWGVMKDAPPVR